MVCSCFTVLRFFQLKLSWPLLWKSVIVKMVAIAPIGMIHTPVCVPSSTLAESVKSVSNQKRCNSIVNALELCFQLRPSSSKNTSVCLSVCLSVCHTFFTMFLSSYRHKIFRSYYQWQKWCPCKRSRSYVKGQGHRGHDPTEPFPDCNSSFNSHMMIKWCIKLDGA